MNVITFGFDYGVGNHSIQLPLVNWLKNPSLYPGDPITEYFERYPSFFWHLIALGSNWLGVRELLFLMFILTKILFFLAITRLLSGFISSYASIAIICVATALSPMLNHATPFGNSDMLESIQTHSSLAVALLLWLGPLLIERRWLMVGCVLGVGAYVNALFVLYALLPVLAFSWLDWQSHKAKILQAGAVFATVLFPWVLLSRGKLPLSYPPDFINTLLMIYPRLVTLRSHSRYVLLHGACVLIAVLVLSVICRYLRIEHNRRFELLIGTFVVPVLIGAIVGELLPTEHLMRLQFLRADSLLIPFCILYVQIIGYLLLAHSLPSYPATGILVGVSALLFPLSDGFGLFALLVIGLVLLADPNKTFEIINRKTAEMAWTQQIGLLVVVAAIVATAFSLGLGWSLGKLAALASLMGGYLFYLAKSNRIGVSGAHLANAQCCLILAVATFGSIPETRRLWDPIKPPDSMTSSWFEAQKWAKEHTSYHRRFLVPPWPAGFRAFSERAVWTDFRDGDIIFTYPEYTEAWLERMGCLGVGLSDGKTYYENVFNQYRVKPWEELLDLARRNRLDYIIQFSNVNYNITPLYKNNWFAVYSVGT